MQKLEAEKLAKKEQEERDAALEELRATLTDTLEIENTINIEGEPLLGVIKKTPKAPPPSENEEHTTIEVEDHLSMRTEPIRIPIFNGEKDNWIMFREQFLTFVHNRKKVPESSKIQLLFTHLGDKALRSIKSITPVAANYQRA